MLGPWSSPGISVSFLLDVALWGWDFPVRSLRNQDGALELGDERVVLLVDAGVDLDDAAVRLRLRRAHLEHLGLTEQRVAVEDRVRVREVLGGQVRDRLAGNVGDRHAQREAVDERTDDDVLPLL